MSTSAFVIDKETIFDTAFDGLLGGLHHLCRVAKRKQFIRLKKNIPEVSFKSLLYTLLPLRSKTSGSRDLTQQASAELPRRFFDQHLLDWITQRPEYEYWPGRGALHLLDPLVCQAHTV